MINMDNTGLMGYLRRRHYQMIGLLRDPAHNAAVR